MAQQSQQQQKQPILYHIPRTISSPIVQIVIELNLIKNNTIQIKEMDFNTIKSKEYINNINPMGTSPAFIDHNNNITIWESGAIIDYILELYDINYILHPSSKSNDIQKWAKYIQLKQYIIATVYPYIASMYIHSLKTDIDHNYMNTAKEKCHTVFGPVLTKWLGDGPYFLGEQISVIDFIIAKPLSNAKSMGLLEAFPTLEVLYNRVSSLASYKQAYEKLTLYNNNNNSSSNQIMLTTNITTVVPVSASSSSPVISSSKNKKIKKKHHTGSNNDTTFNTGNDLTVVINTQPVVQT